MATAYPDRVSTNLRGSWIRQLAMTVVGTLLLYNVVFRDYKVRCFRFAVYQPKMLCSRSCLANTSSLH